MTHKNVTITDKEKSTKEITGEVASDILEQKREEALKNFARDVEVDGFRKGNAPTDVVEKHIGEDKLMTEAAHLALSDAYPAIITEHGIRAIGQPQIAITKLARGNDLGFTITTAVVPEVNLPDYKKVAKDERAAQKKKSDGVEVTDTEVEETITQVRKNVAQQRAMEAQQNFKAGEETPSMPEIKDEDLPELTDDFVKTLGDFKDVDDFKAKLRGNLKQEKERKERENIRQAIAEKLIEQTKIDLPDLVVEAELEKMLARMKDDVSRAGIEFPEYLEKIGKKEDDLRTDWRESAEKKAAMQLILNKIAAEEDIRPDKDVLENEVSQLKEMHPDAQDAHIMTYVETYLTNEEVLKFLEKQGD